MNATSEISDVGLEQLRDIRLPPPTNWWPPAPGWWLVLLLVLGIGGILLWWRLHGHRQSGAAPFSKRDSVRIALTEWEEIRTAYQNSGDALATAAALNILLRRLALAHRPRMEVAGLTGEAWLQLLDQMGGSQEFQQGVGRALLDLPYRRQGMGEMEPLLQLVQDWLHHIEGSP